MPIKRFKALAGHIKTADSGIAAVEFALIVPMLLLIYLGAVDLTQGLMADRKLTHLAGTLSDLVARQAAETVESEDIEAYFAASTALMRPYDATQTGMRVTIASVDSGGTAEVLASTAANGIAAMTVGNTVDIPSEIAALAADRCVVIGESWHAYSPMFRYVFQADVPLYQRAINIPRMESEDCKDAGLSICAGFSGNAVQGMNCNNPNNSWGTGNGQGGGLSNGGGQGGNSGGNQGNAGSNISGSGNGQGGGPSNGGGQGGNRDNTEANDSESDDGASRGDSGRPRGGRGRGNGWGWGHWSRD